MLNLENYYLPTGQNTTVGFLKEVLAGNKKLLKQDQIKPVIVPKYDELAVKDILEAIKDDSEVL